MRLKSIQVNEGGRVSISSDNLKVVSMDYSKFGVTDNDIIFHVTVQPSHGVVDLSDWERHEVKRFSLADIKSDKVLNINCHNISSTIFLHNNNSRIYYFQTIGFIHQRRLRTHR